MTARHGGRVALVTGAGRGIGRAVAARFGQEGARVALVERDEAAGRDAADELGAQADVRLFVADVSDVKAMQKLAADVIAWAGHLDVLVHNAAVADPHYGSLASGDLAAFRHVLEIGLVGPLALIQAALPALRARKGAILNITSTRAVMSEPDSEAYAAAKGGLTALTHALAVSLGPDVRVNAVAPGWIATDRFQPRNERKEPVLRAVDHAQHPVGRVGKPEDIAALCAYLASDEAGFITGQVFTADGGMTRKMIYEE